MNTQRPATLSEGTLLEACEIRALLGQGNFGATYLGCDTDLDWLVAVKEYLPSALAVRHADGSVAPVGAEAAEAYRFGLDRFVAEAKRLVTVRHENVVRVGSVHEARGTAYLIMEHETGRPLADVLKAGELSDESALRTVLDPLLDGLAQLHAAGIVHADIHPSNIRVRADGTPVLLEVGGARLALAGRMRLLESALAPGYAPVECYEGDAGVSAATDIYSLAGVLYRALTGDRPPDASRRAHTLTAGRDDPLVPARVAAGAGFGLALLNAIDAGLAVEAADRPQSVTDWRKLLAGEEDDDDVTVVRGHPRSASAAAKAPVSEQPRPGSADGGDSAAASPSSARKQAGRRDEDGPNWVETLMMEETPKPPPSLPDQDERTRFPPPAAERPPASPPSTPVVEDDERTRFPPPAARTPPAPPPPTPEADEDERTRFPPPAARTPSAPPPPTPEADEDERTRFPPPAAKRSPAPPPPVPEAEEDERTRFPPPAAKRSPAPPAPVPVPEAEQDERTRVPSPAGSDTSAPPSSEEDERTRVRGSGVAGVSPAAPPPDGDAERTLVLGPDEVAPAPPAASQASMQDADRTLVLPGTDATETPAGAAQTGDDDERTRFPPGPASSMNAPRPPEANDDRTGLPPAGVERPAPAPRSSAQAAGEPEAETAHPSSRRTLALAATGTVAALLIAAAGVVFWPGGDEPPAPVVIVQQGAMPGSSSADTTPPASDSAGAEPAQEGAAPTENDQPDLRQQPTLGSGDAGDPAASAPPGSVSVDDDALLDAEQRWQQAMENARRRREGGEVSQALRPPVLTPVITPRVEEEETAPAMAATPTADVPSLQADLARLTELQAWWADSQRQQAEQERQRLTEEQAASFTPEVPAGESAARIGRLLEAAEEDLAATRLTSPAGNNAFEKYLEVLELEPGNERALQGKQRIVQRYLELVAGAEARGQRDRAEVFLERAERVVPGDPAVAAARAALN